MIYLRRFSELSVFSFIARNSSGRHETRPKAGISVQIWDGFDANRHGMNCENWVINQSNSNQDRLEPIKQRRPHSPVHRLFFLQGRAGRKTFGTIFIGNHNPSSVCPFRSLQPSSNYHGGWRCMQEDSGLHFSLPLRVIDK